MKKFEKTDIEDVLALTPMQEGMLYQYLKNPGSDLYFEQLSLEVSADFKVPVFEKAWNFVIETNEMLRSVFQWEKIESPVQLILKEHKLQVVYYDFSGRDISEKGKRLEVEKIKVKDRGKKFALHKEVPFRITLCKIKDDRYEMVISNHHIIYDGWSIGIILTEFFKAYGDLCNGRELIRPCKNRFKQFIKWIQSRDTGSREKFWENCLKGFDTQTNLSVKNNRKSKKGKETASTERFRICFGKDIKTESDNFVRKHKVTLASLIYCTWGILLQKFNNTDDVIFGTTVSGRCTEIQGIEDIVGLFINTLPLRVHTNSNEKTGDLLRRIDKALQMREEYQTTSLVNIKEYSEIESKEELFNTIVIIENYPLDIRSIQENNKLSIDSYSIFEMTHYEITISVRTSENIEFIFLYDKELFNEDFIVRLSGYLRLILQHIIRNPGKEVSCLEIISNEEKNRVLYEFNNTGTDFPQDKTISQLFAEQVETTPEKIALVGNWQLAVGKEKRIGEPAQLTYKELNEKSNQLARRLKEKGSVSGTIVGIMVDRSIEMIIGILGILTSNSAYLPIDPEYPGPRIEYMLKDSNTKILVSMVSMVSKVNAEIELILLDKEMGNNSPTQLTPPPHPPTQLCYVIYTSGTTGKPKGTLTTHANVIRVVKNCNYIELKTTDRILQLSNYAFDGSVFDIYGALLNGAALVMIERETVLAVDRLAKFIKKEQVTVFFVTTALFNTLVDLEIDCLADVRKVLFGGETVSVAHSGKALKYFGKDRIIHVYGPTETTVFATHYLINQIDETSGTIPIGKPLANTSVYILDKYLVPVPIGISGEIFIGGSGVARGYLNDPELTAEKFIAAPASSFKCQSIKKVKKLPAKGIYCHMSFLSSRSYIYRTGDLAYWLPDGNIVFSGRMDHQIKIRGFRVELDEIENQLLTHPNVKKAVVLARENETEDKYLCAYIVTDLPQSPGFARLKDYLSQTLPDYMIPAYFVKIEKMPLTSTGKIDRKGLPEPEITRAAHYTAPRDKLEEVLVEIYSGVLFGKKRDLLQASLPPPGIGIDANFFQLGGHSLKAAALVSKIHKELNVTIPVSRVFQLNTIRQLAEYIRTAANHEYYAIKAAEKKEYYTLSPGQRRLYIIQQMEEQRISYNMFHAVVLNGDVSVKRLEKTFIRLIKRHESLRTSFEILGQKPVQRIHEDVDLVIEYDEAQSIEIAHHSFIRAFDLSQAPLLRVKLIKLPGTDAASITAGGGCSHLLMLDMHHIISDGASIEIFVKEFVGLYQDSQLPPVKLQYKDFSQWQAKWFKSEKMKRQKAYWLKQFEGDIPKLILPLDYERLWEQRFDFDRVMVAVEKELTIKIKTLIRENGVTMYMLLLVTYYILLSKYSGQEDIVVGSGLTGRTHPDMENIIGMFVNMVALRCRPSENKTFSQFLGEVRQCTLAAYENQDYPFDELVKELNVAREYGRNPLFDTEFTFQNVSVPSIKIPGLKVEPYEYENDLLKFDLSLTAYEANDTVHLILGYSKQLLKRSTIETMLRHFIEILAQLSENENILLKNIKITYNLSAAEAAFDKADYTGFEF